MGIDMGDEPVFTGRVVVKLGRKQGSRRIHRDKKGLIAITDCFTLGPRLTLPFCFYSFKFLSGDTRVACSSLEQE